MVVLSALMGVGAIYVMTHDSIGLGEDGPTHQPVEHLASLRAMPNLLVFRPADAVETAEAWQPETEIRYAATQQVVSYRRSDIDRRVKSGERFTIGGTVYTVYSMAPYPDSWNEFEGKAVVEAG